MTLRPAPGEQLGRGRLRVDATKAIAKLREYQLVDRAAWILEAIRAAVAAGATSIDLQGDANDIWLSWSGQPWAAADLPRLFDELVSPEPGAARHHVRLLASAVNSALGSNPAFVDVYAITGGAATRVRYTPDVLEAPPTDGESRLAQLTAQSTESPRGVTQGMHVHFRRRMGLDVVNNWLARNSEELAMARAYCLDIATPIRIGNLVLDRATNNRDVIRIPLGDDVEGFLAIRNTTISPPRTDIDMTIAERGVLLEAALIHDLGLRATAPVRLFIDGPRMPTNASRSEVRRDGHPVETAMRRARELVPDLVAKLVETCRASPIDPAVRHAAIHLLASECGGRDWAHRAREIQPPLRALAELPLLRDAAGVVRPLMSSWSGLVHTGEEALPQELAPWLSHVLWAPPSDPASALPLAWLDHRALADHVRLAKQARRAEKKFYKHAPREPRVLGRRKPRVRARLGAPLPDSCIPDSVFEGLAGEVCVYRDRRGGTLTVMLGGRDIETVEFESTLGFAAVIDSACVSPANRFRGVVRDTEYARVERAMSAAIVRAIEAVALAQRGQFVDGYQVAVAADPALDVQLVKTGLQLARNVGAPTSVSFAAAAIWNTTDGRRSLEELRAHRVLGLAQPQTTVPPLEGRLIVYADEADRAVLADLVPARFVAYEAWKLASRVTPAELAAQITGTHALAVREGPLVVAAAPSNQPRLVLYHRGAKLAELTYTPALAPCTIAVDSDELVPNDAWDGLAGDAGLATADYAKLERQLAREVTSAIIGEPSQLVGDGRIELAGALGQWLCDSLTITNCAEVLGSELFARLRMCSLFRVLGEPHAFSVDELALKFAGELPYVESAGEPVAGFPVVVASSKVARMIGALAGRTVVDATEQLARRRVELARELRLGMHRARSPQPIEVAGTHVKLGSSIGRGVVGVGRDTLEVQVLLEGRLFQTITRPTELPLAAVFEVDGIGRIDDKLEAVRPDVADQIVARVRGMAPVLLRAIAEQYPEALADAGPRRALLASFLAKHPLPLDVREVLVRAVKFATVQAGRATIIEARSGPAIQICAWTGEWLAPDGDAHDKLDRPILHLAGSPELAVILPALGNAVDVTHEVDRLQAQRRIARGLLPQPKVDRAAPELTRSLAALGTTFRHLGPGEVALVGDSPELLLHVQGVLRERIRLDCTPAIQLAIEAGDLVGDNRETIDRRIGPDARELAILLVRDILSDRAPDTLPVDIRRNLRRPILAGRLPELVHAPVFETVTGAWTDLDALRAQQELFGNLWCVETVPHETTPLDERRLVFVMSLAEQTLAAEHDFQPIYAGPELVLDAKSRRNQARELATSLALDDAQGVLGTVTLPGDGVTAPRGIVAVLAPNAAAKRGLKLHRAMHPFDDAPDPCRWPTVARIDDARFTPDRCWEQPERDEIYKAAIDQLHRASNEALRTLVPPPASALAAIRIAPWTCEAITSLRGSDTQLRGAVWIDGPPLPVLAPSIRVIEATRVSPFVPLRGVGLAGELYVVAPKGWPQQAVLEELATVMYAKLVGEMIAGRRRDSDVVRAHVAWALALGRIAPDAAKDFQFECFRPFPINAAVLHAILTSNEPVTVVLPDSTYNEHALVDDGSHTARVIRTFLGTRSRAPSTRRRSDTVEPIPSAVEHPLQPFVNKLHARITALGVPVPAWRIADGRTEPIARYDTNVLELAANHRHVVEVAAAVAASTAWSNDALDALAAHCITVLNVALTSITDTTEAAAIGRLLV